MGDQRAGEPAGSYPCPVCGAAADVVRGCSGCGQPPDPQAAEVIGIDRLAASLRLQLEVGRHRYLQLQHRLNGLVAERNVLAAQVRARHAPPVGQLRPDGQFSSGQWPEPTRPTPPLVPPVRTPSPVTAPGAALAGPVPPEQTVVAARAEATSRTVQNVLFVLGGLLLGTAAVVFTAAAFTSFGLVGRAVILAVVTFVTLAVPPVARWRGLTATAETFAALGLLLVPLDGYAAWHVDLAGLAHSFSPRSYAGLVFGVTAVLGAGYAHLTRLAVPRYAGLAAAQPVLPLLAADRIGGPAAWSAVCAVVAALDLLVVALVRRRRGGAGPDGRPAELRAAATSTGVPPAGWAVPPAGRAALLVVACTYCGLALATAALLGFDAMLADALSGRTWDGAWRAGVAIALVAAVVLGTGVVSGSRALGSVASGAATVLLTGAGAYLAAAGVPGAPALAASAIVALVAGLGTLLPASWRAGPRFGSLAATGVAALTTAGTALAVAVTTAVAGPPGWIATLRTTVPVPHGAGLPVVPLLLAVAAGLPLRRARSEVATVGAGLAALLVPAAVALPWWAPSIVDVAVLPVVAVAAVRAPRGWQAATRSGVALLLLGHAVLAGLARPSTTAAVLGAVAVTGLVVAAFGRDAPAGCPGRLVGTVSMALGVLAWPGLAASLAALGAPGPLVAGTPAPLAAALAGVLLAVVAVGALRGGRYAVAGAFAVGIGGLGVVAAAVRCTGTPFGVFAAVVVLCDLVAGLLARRGPLRRPLVPGWSGALAAVPALAAAPVLAAVAAALPGIVLVWAAPYGWLAAGWAGVAAGVGLTPGGAGIPTGPLGAGPAALTLGLLAVAAAGLRAFASGGSRAEAAGTGSRAEAAGTGSRAEAAGTGPAAGESAPAAGGIRARVGGALRWAAPLAAPAGLLACVAAGTPWPVVPALSLAVALVAGYAAARVRTGRPPVDLAVLGAVCAGAGLCGLLAGELSTLIGLDACAAVAVAAGVAGRTVAARATAWSMSIATWLLSVVAALLVRATQAGSWPTYWVLGTAALALATSVVVRLYGTGTPGGRSAESPGDRGGGARDGADRTAADLRVSRACRRGRQAVGSRRRAACARPGDRPGRPPAAGGRRRLVRAARVLAAGDRRRRGPGRGVQPAAGGRGAAHRLAGSRGQAALRSWLAYGPALLAGFAPSLATAITGGAPLRRLGVGVAAVAIVLIGSRARRQAPVVVGSVVLIAVVLNELARLWDLLPRWIPLGLAGLLLLAVATTYERRLRDMTRLRDAVGRMR